MAWQLYNISFDDKSALFYYEPYRGGSANGSDIHSSAEQSTWVAYNTTGRESSYTTSFGGASVTLQLPAMVSAFWIYGECNASAVTIHRSWDGDAILNNATEDDGGVIYSEGGLTQDLNEVTLVVNNGSGPVTIEGATVAIKMGADGSTIKATNISTVIESIPALNPYFTVNGTGSSWEGELAFGPNGGLEAIIGTNTSGDYVTFSVNSSVAFAVYGANDPYQGTFVVDIDPPLPYNASASATYNSSSPWTTIEEIKYLAAGLDDTETYMVNISNVESGKGFNMGQVILYTAIPPASSTASTSRVPYSHHALSSGAIAGATIGSVSAAVVLAFIAVVFFQQRKRRTGLSPFEIEPEATPIDPIAPQLPNSTHEVFSRQRLSSIVSRPFVKAYADSVDVALDMPTPQGSDITEVLYPKSENVTPEPDTAAVAGPSTAASVSPLHIIATHAEDAGPVQHEELPPVYNPEWNNSTPRVT